MFHINKRKGERFFVPNVVISGAKCNGRVLHGESIGYVKDIDV